MFPQNQESEMRIRSEFPRYQETFTLTIQRKSEKKQTEGKDESKRAIAKMYVGKYFTEAGVFDQVWISTFIKFKTLFKSHTNTSRLVLC